MSARHPAKGLPEYPVMIRTLDPIGENIMINGGIRAEFTMKYHALLEHGQGIGVFNIIKHVHTFSYHGYRHLSRAFPKVWRYPPGRAG